MLLIDEELRNRGLTTHCDKNRHPSPYSNDKKQIMCSNIDDAESILVFITQKFMGKVNGMDGNNDVCKMEFEYALKTASSKIVLVILEARMRNVSTWKGQLRYYLNYFYEVQSVSICYFMLARFSNFFFISLMTCMLITFESSNSNNNLKYHDIRKCIGDRTKIIDMVEQEDEDVFNLHMDELIDAVAAAKRTPRRR